MQVMFGVYWETEMGSETNLPREKHVLVNLSIYAPPFLSPHIFYTKLNPTINTWYWLSLAFGYRGLCFCQVKQGILILILHEC